jgi:hypothetical protein
MHQQLWGYKVEWKSVSRGTGGKRLNTTALRHFEIKIIILLPTVRDSTEGRWETMAHFVE